MKSTIGRLYGCFCLFVSLILCGCSVNRYIPEGAYMLEKVSITSEKKELKVSEMGGYVRQHPNSKWFSLVKVPLRIYSLSGSDSTGRFNRFLRRMGEPPVIYDKELALQTRQNVELAVRNLGYLGATVDLEENVRKKRIRVRYIVHPGERYFVRNVERDIQDPVIGNCLKQSDFKSGLYTGMPFNLNVLDAERGKINSYLQNCGYYKFNKDFLRFEADTLVGNRMVDICMRLTPMQLQDGTLRPHTQYTIGDVKFEFQQAAEKKSFLRPGRLGRSIMLQRGAMYRERDVQETYSRIMRMGAVLSSNVRFAESKKDSSVLDATISLLPNRRNSFKAELEGTNSAGDLGAAVSLSYQNRNLFRGSELLTIKVRGAFEAIKGLRGYADQNFLEYSAQVGVSLPELVFPFLSHSVKRKTLATSEVSLSYDSQDRPEFHRRVVTASWKYRWIKMNSRLQHKVDLLDINYVFMPWISTTFADRYLNDPQNRNAILRYNYENLYIVRWGYNFSYSSQSLNGSNNNYGTNAYIIRGGVETAGNLMHAISNLAGVKSDKDGHRKIFDIAYAQYVKADFDFSKSFMINKYNSLAVHFGLGVALPYGNSNILPYEKRYFSGGANSVRGWSVRELGPGTFAGHDGRIDFINQTGDVKLDMNLEYRTHLVWKLDGAVFVDAGNIWTLREYDEQPGGQFRFNTFLEQIAMAYGLGIRFNFNYFILRMDGGMKAINPAFSDSYHHYPIIHPDFGRDFSFHFAVGLPF